MAFHRIEVMKFLKDNILKILIGTGLFAGLFFFLTNRPIKSEETLNKEANHESIENTEEALPANFYFFVENEDGTPFNNHQLIEQYVLSTEILQGAAEEVDFDLVQLIEDTSNTIKVDYRDSKEVKMIGVSKNDTSSLIEFYTNVGNEEKNLAVVQYFYNYILDGKIPFLANKEVTVFKKPALKEVKSDYDVLSDEQMIETESNKIVNIIVGVGLGFSLSLITIWILSLFSKKLKYSISYFLEEDDFFLLVDKNLDEEEELQNILEFPENEKKYIVRENHVENLNAKIENMLESLRNETALEEVNSITEIPDVQNMKRLIYFVEEGLTTRNWFKKQRKLDELYNIQTFVVQINKDNN